MLLTKRRSKVLLCICLIPITLCGVQSSNAERETRKYESTIVITDGVVINGDTPTPIVDFGRITQRMYIDGFDTEKGELISVKIRMWFFTGNRFHVMPWKLDFLCYAPHFRFGKDWITQEADPEQIMYYIVDDTKRSIIDYTEWFKKCINCDPSWSDEVTLLLDEYIDVSRCPASNPCFRGEWGPHSPPGLTAAVKSAAGRTWCLEFVWNPGVTGRGASRCFAADTWWKMKLRVQNPNDPSHPQAYAITHHAEITYIWEPPAPPDPTPIAPIAPLLLLD